MNIFNKGLPAYVAAGHYLIYEGFTHNPKQIWAVVLGSLMLLASAYLHNLQYRKRTSKKPKQTSKKPPDEVQNP